MDTPPPQFSRYRLIEDYPDKLDYPSGRVLLTFCANRGNCGMLYATKENEPGSFLEIMRGPDMHQWSRARFEGFEVERGSPADKIMLKLVSIGGAVPMVPGEIYRQKRQERRERYH